MTKKFYDALWTRTTFGSSPSKLIRERWILGLIKDYIDKKSVASPLRILDLGCGRGTLLGKLKRRGSHELLGVDYSQAAVELNKKELPDIGFFVRDLEEDGWSFDLGSVDVAISQEVIEHLSPRAQKVFLREISNLVKTNGYLILTTPDWEAIQGLRNVGESDEEFALRFEGQPNANLVTRKSLANEVSASGFHVLEHFTVAPYARRRVLTALMGYLFYVLPGWVEKAMLERNVFFGKYQILLAQKNIDR